jgi:caffeoyl-CoA O-methyltransferase
MFKNIEVTRKLLNYIYNHSTPLNIIQKKILDYNQSLGDIKKMQISETQAHFLQLIIKIANVKKCLEIGTFTGFSALSMALALPKNGKLVTLDNDEKNANVAKKFFKEALFDKKIQVIIGSALSSLDKVAKNNERFDLIFVDADKRNYSKYFDISLELLNKESLIIFDNVLWRGDVSNDDINDKQTNNMRDFNTLVKNDKRVEKIILPIGDGLTICRKI